MALCGKCGRTLKDPESIQRGFGPICYKKIMPSVQKKIGVKRKENESAGNISGLDLQIPGQMKLSDFIGT